MARSTVCGDTGNLSTLTFATGITAALKFRYIDPSEESIGNIDCSHLATTVHRSVVKEDLSDTPELSMEYNWDTFDEPPVVGLDLGNATHTYPLRPGEVTPATRVGKAYVSAIKHPRMENNVLQVGMLKIKYTETPAYTKST